MPLNVSVSRMTESDVEVSLWRFYLDAMKLFTGFILAIALLTLPVTTTFTGCSTSAQRTTVNTLFSVGQTADSAYKSYLDLVVSGQLKTNDVPEISRRYQQFQQVFSAAITASALSSNSPPSPMVSAAAAQLTQAITIAKQRK